MRRLRALDWRRRPLAFLAVSLVATLALAGAVRFAGSFFGPADGARWIWADGSYDDGRPIAFYAASDLELEAGGDGRLSIVADETYVLYVNGRRVGAGSYRPRAPVDEYDVGHLLEAGLNRVLVELRSSRGAGGLLARLEVGGWTKLATDGDWRIFRRYDPALFGGWSGLEAGEPPKVWQRLPTGRWRPGDGRRPRPIPFDGFPPPERRRPLRFQQQPGGQWVDLDWSRSRIPAFGPHQLYDFGREVEGFCALDLTAADGQPGLVFFGSEPPDPSRRPPDEILLPVPGRRFWESAFPRRFRYLLVIGAEAYSRVEVEVLDAAMARELAPPADLGGIFGLESPRSYSKVEEDVWGRLGRRKEEG